MKTKTVSSTTFWWVLSVVGTLFLASLAYIIVNQIVGYEIIANYIAAFATLLSIVLSVFAIIYTYTSNAEISQHFLKINSAADNIRNTSSRLTETNAKFRDNLQQILDKLDTIDHHQRNFSDQLQSLNAPFNAAQTAPDISNKINRSYLIKRLSLSV